jgi:hypothetical protein
VFLNDKIAGPGNYGIYLLPILEAYANIYVLGKFYGKI